MKILIQNLYNRYRNLILYCMIGCVGASLDFGIFTVLTAGCALHHQFANLISISCGIITDFFLNYYFNFKSNGKLLLRLFSFYCVGLTGLGLSALLLWLFIDSFSWAVIPSKVATIFLVTAMQYTLNKIISFRRGKKC